MNFFAQLKYLEGSFWCANAETLAERLENEARNGLDGESETNGKDSRRIKIPVKIPLKVNEIESEQSDKPDMPVKESGRSRERSLELSGSSDCSESKEGRDDKGARDLP